MSILKYLMIAPWMPSGNCSLHLRRQSTLQWRVDLPLSTAHRPFSFISSHASEERKRKRKSPEQRECLVRANSEQEKRKWESEAKDNVFRWGGELKWEKSEMFLKDVHHLLRWRIKLAATEVPALPLETGAYVSVERATLYWHMKLWWHILWSSLRGSRGGWYYKSTCAVDATVHPQKCAVISQGWDKAKRERERRICHTRPQWLMFFVKAVSSEKWTLPLPVVLLCLWL